MFDMHQAAIDAEKTLLVLSEDYLNAEFTQPEWSTAFADDPKSLKRKIIPIRVRECQPRGLLRPIVYVDLVGLESDDARKAILEALPDRLKPDTEPSFPTSEIAQTTKEPPEFPTPLLSKPWNVPYERNTFFTGREEILKTLRQQLNQDKAAVLSQIQAISGLGGIGKTQTAVEYAYRYRHDYDAVFWVRAETELELRTGFVEIAHALDLLQKDEQDFTATIKAVKEWLETQSGWLLILDNADHPEYLKSFRPNHTQGHILLTSRAQTFDTLGIAQPVSLSKMPAEEAVAFLFKRTGRDSDNSTEHTAVEILTNELGCLPLALEQAGAYVLAKQVSFQDYLKSYRKHRLKLLEKSDPVTGDYLESVATTWSLNFREVKATSTDAADLLRVSAFLSPDAIPYELFEQGASHLGENLNTALAEMNDDPIVFLEVISPLVRYSLVHIEPSMRIYSIARLVQEVVKAGMDETQYCLWAERTIEAVTQAFPEAAYGNWTDCDRLLPHAKVGLQLATADQFESKTTALLLSRTGDYLRKCAQYGEAEPLYQEALAMRKQLLGNEHPDVALSLNNLALLYFKQGRYNEVEPLYQKALAMRRQLLGNEHPDVALSLNNLASLYDQQGRYNKAEPLYQEALAMRKRLSGEKHPNVAVGLNNLALLFFKQGRYDEAEPLYQEALAMSKQLMGDEHPSVAVSLNNLASLYSNQGRYDEAEPLYQEALAMRKQLMGDEHPDVAGSLNNLAFLYSNQGRYDEAEPLSKEALVIWQRLLGDEHPDVASGLNNLAFLYSNQGRYDEAEPLYQEALEMWKRLLGEEHPNVALNLNNLAMFYDQQGRYDEAEPLYQEALAMRKRLLGDKHLDVALSLNNLAFLYCNQGRYNKAEPLFQEALMFLEQAFGSDHPSTNIVRENLKGLPNKDNRGDRWILTLLRCLINKLSS